MSVRVRIAPSPTGLLHIGTARSALFNMLFARSLDGVFIVRIEDTDKKRNKKEYEEDILENLQWLGISWDEFYRSTEQINEHQKAITSLLSSNRAYRCFCSTERLQEARIRAEKEKRPFTYDGTCRQLSIPEQEKRALSGESFVVRLKVDQNEPIKFTDLIRGDITFPLHSLDDFVISKGVNHPLYHLAVVVDDAAANITHVIRGEDHLSNTPKHILLQQALDIPTPQYAHIPLILDESGKKLSKRSPHMETLIHDYRSKGYLPEAIVNTLALVGWNSKTEQEIFTTKELIATFRIEDIQKGGATFSKQRLDHINRQHIRRLKPESLLSHTKPFLKKTGLDNIPDDRLLRGIIVEQERITSFSEVPKLLSYISSSPTIQKKDIPWKDSSITETKEVVTDAIEMIQSFNNHIWESREALEHELLQFADESNKGRGTILWPIRYVLCGEKKSPGPHELAWVLGKEETIKRLEYALSMMV